MAIKNTKTKNYEIEYEKICNILRCPDFSKCLDAAFIEEAILSDAVEFRFIRKSTLWSYGRNYFIKVRKIAENSTDVSITVQSRKVTVLIDPNWEQEADKAYNFIEILLK